MGRLSAAEMLEAQARARAVREKAGRGEPLSLEDLAELRPAEVLQLVEAGALANHGIGQTRRTR